MLYLFAMMFVAGLILLIKGADFITEHASELARRAGISELAIGITLVAFATSLPELAVSLLSAFQGVGQIASGTIIGSNIFNVGVVIGFSAFLAPIATKKMFFKEAIIMLGFMILASFFMLGGFTPLEGIVFLMVFFVYIYFLVKKRLYDQKGVMEHAISFVKKRFCFKKARKFRHIALIIIGGIGIWIGAELLVHSTIGIATEIGISEIVIAGIAIAGGTSLPEFSTSVAAALKRMRGISVGNIIGSNIFNMAILSIASLAAIIPADIRTISINLPIMLILSILLPLFIAIKWKISRPEGLVFIVIFIFFVWMQF